VKILESDERWVQVEFSDPQHGRRVGYVPKEHVRIVSATPTTPPPQGVSAPPGTQNPLQAKPERPGNAVKPAEATPGKPDAGGNAQAQNLVDKAKATVKADQTRPPLPPKPSKLKETKIRGYVTAVTSPTEFEIEDYRITRGERFVLDIENADPNLKFQPEDIRVGVELEIQGTFNDASGELHAKSIKIDMEQFKTIKHTAVLSRPPQGIERSAEGWTGLCFADGQRIRIIPASQVVFGLTSREKNAVKQQAKKDKDEKAPTDAGDALDFQPLASLDQVTVGMIMKYEGRRNPKDGIIEAERVEFVHNDLEKGEKSLRDALKVETKAFDGSQLRPGELKIDHVGKFKTLPNVEVQEYVSDIGQRMIPAYQREMPASDPNKIAFQFFVVLDKTPNAFATPNGIVVVNSGLFDVLENEGQLAFILGHEVSHAVQEHSWLQREYHKKKLGLLAIGGAVAAAYGQYAVRDLATMVEGAVRSGYSRNLENQADRLGLESMVNAGYDPRQAPAVWKVMATKVGDSGTNFFWSTHDNNATRRSYLMNELKNNYSTVDYGQLSTEQTNFKVIAERVRLTEDSKRKNQVR